MLLVGLLYESDGQSVQCSNAATALHMVMQRLRHESSAWTMQRRCRNGVPEEQDGKEMTTGHYGDDAVVGG